MLFFLIEGASKSVQMLQHTWIDVPRSKWMSLV